MWEKEKVRRGGFIAASVIPAFVLYCVAVLVPNFFSALLSLFKWNGLNWDFKFVGLENYKKVFADPIVAKAFWNNIYFAIFTMILAIGLALIISAVLCNNTVKRPNFYISLFYFPNIMSAVVVSILWKFMYDPQFGIINAVLNLLGKEEWTRIWLGDINTVRPALVFPQVWASVGLYILLYTSTIKGINPSLYEAACIDGANKIQQFTKITLPLIWPTVKISMVYFMAGCLNAGFAFIKIMTNGGPNRESVVLTSYLYEKAFTQGDYGFGASIGMIVLILGFAFYFIIEKVFKSETYET